MADLILTVEPESPELLSAIGDGLRAYNDAQRQPFGRINFMVKVTTPDGTIFGGAKCKLSEGMLFTEWLWVDDKARGGTGRAVMEMVENHARAHGATMAYLDTFSFQARGFYEKLGYQVFGTLPYPHGGIERYFMNKNL
jgi:GNAT superfamily N-acetyltransferase